MKWALVVEKRNNVADRSEPNDKWLDDLHHCISFTRGRGDVVKHEHKLAVQSSLGWTTDLIPTTQLKGVHGSNLKYRLYMDGRLHRFVSCNFSKEASLGIHIIPLIQANPVLEPSSGKFLSLETGFSSLIKLAFILF